MPPPNEERPPLAPQDPWAALPPSAGASVWVVDDSPFQANMTRRALAARHNITIFGNSAAMLERLSNGERPDIVVLDWHMPETSGLDTCRFVRQLADGAELPILILTASAQEDDLLEGLAAGANDFLTKPASVAELNARVAALVRTKRLHEKLTETEMALRAEHVRLAQTDTALRAEATFREAFLAILAHDLRQPLNVFSMGSETLAAPSTPQQVRDRVAAQLGRASSRMQRMIDELLDFSRTRPAGGMPITRRTCDLARVGRDVVEEVLLAHPARAIELAIVGDCTGSWDADRLAQVVSNLLGNAITHSAAGSTVTSTSSGLDGAVTLSVENTGEAIAADLLPTIFDAFRRGSAPRNARTGLGLGLYIVAEIAKAHNGTATAHSEGGRTRFEVTLPAADAPL